jgi:hypothetical protein
LTKGFTHSSQEDIKTPEIKDFDSKNGGESNSTKAEGKNGDLNFAFREKRTTASRLTG